MGSNPQPGAERRGDVRGRVLVIDGDELARWSQAQYLERWFSVSVASSLEEAAFMLEGGDVTALVVSDGLPGVQIDAVEARARELNPDVLTVRTVVGPGAKRPAASGVRLEKPFQLAKLALLLGVPPTEVPDAE